MRTIDQVLDRAREVQKVPSDYKLGLTLGIGGNSLSNYRTGRSYPDEKTCQILAQALGEDPALLTVEMQAQRAKTPEAKQIWISIANRLQSGFALVEIPLLIAIVLIAGYALFARADSAFYNSDVAGSVYYVKWFGYLAVSAAARLAYRIVKLCKVAVYVPNPTDAAAVISA